MEFNRNLHEVEKLFSFSYEKVEISRKMAVATKLYVEVQQRKLNFKIQWKPLICEVSGGNCFSLYKKVILRTLTGYLLPVTRPALISWKGIPTAKTQFHLSRTNSKTVRTRPSVTLTPNAVCYLIAIINPIFFSIVIEWKVSFSYTWPIY